MELEQLKREYLNELLVQGFAEGTIRYRRTYLDQFLLFLSRERPRDRQPRGVERAEALSQEHVYRYQARLVQTNT